MSVLVVVSATLSLEAHPQWDAKLDWSY